MKICKKCLIGKPLDMFFNHNSNKDKKFNTCKECDKARYNLWRKNNPEKRAKIRKAEGLRRRHGMPLEEYNKMVEVQNNLCYICDFSPKSTNDPRTLNLQVDHCHKTNKIRKLLCHQCNRALGLLKENPILFLKCIDYINEHK